MTIDLDDALAFLIRLLRDVPDQTGRNPHSKHGCEIWLPDVAHRFWMEQSDAPGGRMPAEIQADYLLALSDAAWELCRRGVLRPGLVLPRGDSAGAGFHGEGYSLTGPGRRWVKSVDFRMLVPIDAGRFAKAIEPHAILFGPAFRQRASEASACYRTSNYLSCCVMCGAATESILLAVATHKIADEGKVLADYRAANGRRRVTDHVVAGLPSGLGQQFVSAIGLLTYWRDIAGHGTETSISEVEAHEALSRLLRLAQLTSDNWQRLIAPTS